LTLYSLLYIFSTKSEVWEIAFDSEQGLNHTLTTTINDFKATEIRIDG